MISEDPNEDLEKLDMTMQGRMLSLDGLSAWERTICPATHCCFCNPTQSALLTRIR